MAEAEKKEVKTEEKAVVETKDVKEPEDKKGEKGALNQVPEDPYFEMEFGEFLKMIGEANLLNWSIMAEALGVHRNTISRWKKTPEARQAIKTSIAHSLQQMETLGAGDWKMHREKLKMLGVDEKQVVENVNNRDSESLEKIADTLQAIYDQEDEKNKRNTNSHTDSTEPNQDKSDS